METTQTQNAAVETSPAMEKEISVGHWMVTMLIAMIPVVNIVMLFVWAFGNNESASKANWAKAALIWTAIVVGLYIIAAMVFGAAMMAAMGS